MRGFITRRYHITLATVGFYDMETNEMVELDSISGNWKNTEQVLKYVKKHRKELQIPEGKQPTVLQMERKSELRKMTLEAFYDASEVVEETPKQETKKANNKKKGKR